MFSLLSLACEKVRLVFDTVPARELVVTTVSTVAVAALFTPLLSGYYGAIELATGSPVFAYSVVPVVETVIAVRIARAYVDQIYTASVAAATALTAVKNTAAAGALCVYKRLAALRHRRDDSKDYNCDRCENLN